VLSKTRWQLRRAVALVNRTLAALKLDKHPDKTWVGKIDRGVDFLGYHHTRAGSCLSGCKSTTTAGATACIPAAATLARFHAQITRLQEQGARPARIGVYKTRWWRWVRAGLPKNLVLFVPTLSSAERDSGWHLDENMWRQTIAARVT
jgi:RNA-directed DNA polymerase